ncbi:MAG: DUF4382 domain-containing protein [Chloroflexota bacterium]
MHNSSSIRCLLLYLIASIALIGCGSTEPEETLSVDVTSQQNLETGTLTILANGEDFVRQGFVSKDGWQIAFEQVIVSLAEIAVYQTDPPYDPSGKVSLVNDADNLAQIQQVLVEDGLFTVDLAAGDETAEPIAVVTILDAPIGQYNAISWQMRPDDSGTTILMQGQASKDETQIDFTIGVDSDYAYSCGEYVGDVRRGFLKAGGETTLEITFHFDHVFGDADAPMDEALNMGALGFDPLAALAEEGILDVNGEILASQLTEDDYNTFVETLYSLGHVGEGHCLESAGGYTGQE